MYQPRAPVTHVLRPAGDSDEYSDSDNEFDMPTLRQKPRNQFNRSNGPGSFLPSNNFNTSQTNCGDDCDENDWGSSSVPLKMESSPLPVKQCLSPAEEARMACSKGNLEKIKNCIEQEGVDVNSHFPDHSTPLITAALSCQLDTIKYLLEKGADVKIASKDIRTTALMAAISVPSEKASEDQVMECVKILIDAQVPVNTQDKHGLSALLMAIKRGKNRLKVAEFLLDNGANPDLVDFNGQTPLLHAAEVGDGRSCRLLMEKGASLHIIDDSGWSAFDLANDKGFSKLGDLIYRALVTKWKPGLSPELMQDIDEEGTDRVKNKNAGSAADGVTIREDSQIEMVLSSMNAERYMENFRKHRVTYVQFLQFLEEDLEKIGIEQVGIRKKLMENIREVHNADWAKDSLNAVPINKKVTAAETVCILNNIKLHMEHISATLCFMHKRILKDPNNLRLGMERNKIQDIIQLCHDVCEKNGKLEKQIEIMEKFMKTLAANTGFNPADNFPTASTTSTKMSGTGNRRGNTKGRPSNAIKASSSDSNSCFQWKYVVILSAAAGVGILCTLGRLRGTI